MSMMAGATAMALSVAGVSGVPPAPKPLPPFTKDVEAVQRLIGARVSAAYQICGDAFANSNARSVEAMGTPRRSAAWDIATSAMKRSLALCKERLQALRDRQDFLDDILANGSAYDSDLAARQAEGALSELKAAEESYTEETVRYHHLVTVGWGSPHCVARPDGYMPPSAICATGEDPFKP